MPTGMSGQSRPVDRDAALAEIGLSRARVDRAGLVRRGRSTSWAPWVVATTSWRSSGTTMGASS